MNTGDMKKRKKLERVMQKKRSAMKSLFEKRKLLIEFLARQRRKAAAYEKRVTKAVSERTS
eukprot:GSA120T00014681001.1